MGVTFVSSIYGIKTLNTQVQPCRTFYTQILTGPVSVDIYLFFYLVDTVELAWFTEHLK